MGQLLPYHPLPGEVIAAIERLEHSNVFDAAAFAIVNQERWRRIPIVLAFILPTAALGAGLVWLADSAGWLGWLATPLYAFFPIVFAALLVNALRVDAVKDEMRLGRAIARWEDRGGRIRETPLELKR